MAWIETHQSLPTHRKNKKLARKLGIKNLSTTVGHLVCFWLWAIDNVPNGCLDDVEPEDIADAAMWTGDARRFVDAMVYAGFIDAEDRGMRIHDWDVYIGKLISQRMQSRTKQQRYRDRLKSADPVTGYGNVTGNVTVTPGNALRSTVPNPTVTQPNRTQPDPTSLPTLSGGEREEAAGLPSLNDVKQYVSETGLNVDAARFMLINEANGWKDKDGKPIRNWRLYLEGYAARQPARQDINAPDPRIAALEAMKRQIAAEDGG